MSPTFEEAILKVTDQVFTVGLIVVAVGVVFAFLNAWGVLGASEESANASPGPLSQERQERIAAGILARRGEFAAWLTDQSFALRLFIGAAEQLSLPDCVSALDAAEDAYLRIERLKIENAEAIAGLDAALSAGRLEEDDFAAVENSWQQIIGACDALNAQASLSPFYVTGYRVQLDDLDPINHSHRIGLD